MGDGVEGLSKKEKRKKELRDTDNSVVIAGWGRWTRVWGVNCDGKNTVKINK